MRDFLRATALAVTLGALAGAVTLAQAAPPSPAQAVKARQAQMKALGAAGKALGEQLRSGHPDAAAVRAQSARFEQAARALPGLFPPGSGAQAGVKTGALPAIWSDPVGFEEAEHRYAAAAGALDAAAQKGDMDGVAHAAGDLGHACKACHDKYRAKSRS